MCGDGQVKLEDIIRAIKEAISKKYDLVKVRRVCRHDGIKRKIITFICNIMMQFFFRIVTWDVNGTPKIFRKELLDKFDIKSCDWFIDTEIMIKSKILKLKIQEVPISFFPRKKGKSNVNFFAIIEFLKNIYKYKVGGEIRAWQKAMRIFLRQTMNKDLKGISVLVTGANGFIGSHLTRELITIGARVNVFIEPNTSLWRIDGYKSKIKVYNVDIANFDKVNTAIQKIQPVKIYHLADKVDVDRSPELIDKMIEANLKGTLNILKALRSNQYDLDCFINTGACEEYGDGQVPFLETQREMPVSAYSSSKLAVTNFCQMLYKTQKLPIVTLRPFLTYGPCQTNDMLIPSLVRKCI